MGPGAGLVVLLLIAGAAGFRAVAGRRLAAGDRRVIPVLLLSTLVVALLLTGTAAWFAVRSPLLGVPLTVGALVLGGGWLRVSLDQAHHAGAPDRVPDRLDDLVGRMDRSYRRIAAGLLGLGFAGAVALLIWLMARGRF